MKLRLEPKTIYWGTAFTSSSANKTLYHKLREQNYKSAWWMIFPFCRFLFFIKDMRTIDLTDDELRDLLNVLKDGAESSYIPHADGCEEALRDIQSVCKLQRSPLL